MANITQWSTPAPDRAVAPDFRRFADDRQFPFAFPYVFPWWLSDNIKPADCLAAWNALGTPSQAQSYINLNNPGTHNLTDPGTIGGHTYLAPAWNSNYGFHYSGNNGFNKTGITLNSINFTVIAAVFDDQMALPGGETILGSNDDFALGFYYNGYNHVAAYVQSQNANYMFTPRTDTGTGAAFLGVVALAGRNLYVNGEHVYTAPVGGAGLSNRELWLGAWTPESDYTYVANDLVLQSASVYNCILTGSEVAAVSNAMPKLGLPPW